LLIKWHGSPRRFDEIERAGRFGMDLKNRNLEDYDHMRSKQLVMSRQEQSPRIGKTTSREGTLFRGIYSHVPVDSNYDQGRV
jgi:hypothetical protein